MMQLSVIIPVYNESENLKALLNSLKQLINTKSYELIVINDCSTDNSGLVLNQMNTDNWFTIINNKVNLGYGASLKKGIKKASGKYVITMDGDGQHNVDEIELLLTHLLETNSDMVIGSRKKNTSSLFRRLGKFLIKFIAKILFPLKIKDLNSGFKVYSRELALKYMPLCPDTMAYSDIITLFFVFKKHLVKETPITINTREFGKSVITYKTAFDTLLEIFNIVMLFNPMRLFLPLATFCIIVGLLWGSQFIMDGKGISVGALLALLTGILFALLGFIAESQSRLKLFLIEKGI